jgi:hypothetical protein
MSQRARRSVALALVIGVLGAAAPPLRAGLVVLDFADLNPQNQNTVYLDPFLYGPYQSHGFTLSSTLGFNTYGTGATNFYAGEKSLAAIASSHVALTQTDGGAFDLLSLDLARNFAFDPAPTVTFTGTRAGGGTVTETFTVTTAVGQAAFQTFDFSGFTNLTQVSWDQPADLLAGLHQFSNIHLETPPAAVPAPPTLVLGGIAACGGLLLARRRRVPTGLRR